MFSLLDPFNFSLDVIFLVFPVSLFGLIQCFNLCGWYVVFPLMYHLSSFNSKILLPIKFEFTEKKGQVGKRVHNLCTF